MIKKWKNLRINLPRKNDLYTFEEVLGKKNQYCLQLFIPLLTPKDIVIDLGAHIGLFSLAISKYVKKVLAIEPDKENFEILNENISINNLSNIIPINKAIASKNGNKTFFLSNLSPARHSFYTNPFLNGDGFLSETIKVSTVSLSNILSNIKCCKILKADIEGAEYDIFFNCPIEILKKIKIFLIEYHNISKDFTGETLEKFFSNLDFKVVKGKEEIYSSQKFIGGHLLVVNPFI